MWHNIPFKVALFSFMALLPFVYALHSIWSLTYAVLCSLFFSFIAARSLTHPSKEHAEKPDNESEVKQPLVSTKLTQLNLTLNKMSQEIESKNATIALANEEALETSKTKNLFLANMGHEIKTPMNGIIGICDLLLNRQTQTEEREFTSVIKDSAESLLIIINDILDFSKVEANQLVIHPQNFSLKDLLNKITLLLREQLKFKNLKIVISIDQLVPSFLIADSDRLRQVLLNLLSNSIKFSQNSNIEINISSKKKDEQSYHIFFSIKDYGIGIAQDKVHKIFQAFNQVDSSITRKYGGTGLGLPISKKLIQLMGGDIKMESALNSGSCFKFSILAERGSAKKRLLNTLETQKESVDQDMGINDLKVLVVEDNHINQKVFISFLKKFGITPDVKANGLEAYKAVGQKKYDLVFMDIQMPVMDGFTATQKIITDYENPPPIFAVTANTFKEDRIKSENVGMTGFISKPIKASDIESVLLLFTKNKTHSITKKRVQLSFNSADENLSLLFDKKQTLSSFAGDEEILEEFLQSFISCSKNYLMEMEQAIKDKDFILLQRNAHTLKGLVANIYAQEIKDCTYKLQKNAESKSEHLVLLDFKELSQLIQLLIPQLEKFLSDFQIKKSS